VPQVFRLDWISFGHRAFDAVDVDVALLRLDVIALQQRDFGGAQTVMVGELKQSTITLAGDNGKAGVLHLG